MELNLILKKNDKPSLSHVSTSSSLLRHIAIGCAFAIGLATSQLSYAITDPVSPPAGEKFSYAWLKGYARALSEKAYISHKGELPKSIKGMSWDDYQQLQFKKDKALWRNDDSEFRAELFHLGLYFDTPVHILSLIHI